MANYTINIRDLDSLLYKVGDTFNNTYLDCFGFISGGGNQLILSIPIAKSLKNINGINFTSLLLSMRTVTGAYVQGLWFDAVPVSTITVAKRENLLEIVCNKSDGWGVTNNTPLTGIVRITGTFI